MGSGSTDVLPSLLPGLQLTAQKGAHTGCQPTELVPLASSNWLDPCSDAIWYFVLNLFSWRQINCGSGLCPFASQDSYCYLFDIGKIPPWTSHSKTAHKKKIFAFQFKT